MTTQLISNDPLSYVYTVLFDMLVAHEPFREQFKQGNLIRFDSDRIDPVKDGRSVSDTPECTLRPSGFEPVQANSSNTQIITRFNLMLRTDKWRVQAYSLVTWEAIRAWLTWKSVANATPWPGNSQPIITDVWIESAEVGQAENLSVNSGNQVLEGWSSLLQVRARLNFITNEIRP